MKKRILLLALVPAILLGSAAGYYRYVKHMRERGIQMIQSGDIDAALDLSLWLRKWDYKYHDSAAEYARAVFFNARFTDERKIEVLMQYRKGSPVFSYYIAILYSRMGEVTKAYELLQPELWKPATFAIEIKQELESAAGDVYAICMRANGTDCKEQSMRIRDGLKSRAWNDALFRARLGALGMPAF